MTSSMTIALVTTLVEPSITLFTRDEQVLRIQLAQVTIHGKQSLQNIALRDTESPDYRMLLIIGDDCEVFCLYIRTSSFYWW